MTFSIGQPVWFKNTVVRVFKEYEDGLVCIVTGPRHERVYVHKNQLTPVEENEK